jgi:hypothetical protein
MRLPLDRRQRIWAVGIASTLIVLALVLFGPPTGRSGSADAPAPPDDPEPWMASGAQVPGPEHLEEVERVQKRVLPDQSARLATRGGGASLELPEGTVTRPTLVELVRYRVDHPRSLDARAYDLQPDGLSLHRPVRLSMALPLGVQPNEVEVARYDPRSGRWRAEARQAPAPDGTAITADLRHFSLRRLRIRPGMDFPRPEGAGRATFFLESDAGNTFERYVEGRWRAVPERTRGYRELMASGRLGRHELIAGGRLRAVSAPRPEPRVLDDGVRTVALPEDAPQARTGWVEVERLDGSGRATGQRVVARVTDVGPPPGQRAAGVVVQLSRATAEALGLTWGEDFGVTDTRPNRAWIALTDPEHDDPLRYVPVRVRSCPPPEAPEDAETAQAAAP